MLSCYVESVTSTTVVGAVSAGLMAFSGPKAEQGAWNVPQTSPWLLHKGETVLPAAAAETFRNMAQGKPAASGGVNFHVSAMDGADVMRVVRRHADVISKAVHGHMTANPSSFG